MSHPSRVRGLKHQHPDKVARAGAVAPLAGAWIETWCDGKILRVLQVAPLAGAWIETLFPQQNF